MAYGKVLVTLMVLGLVFIGCSKPSKPDMSQFITGESLAREFTACEDSENFYRCITRPAIRKAEKYCSDKKMSNSQCEELTNAVLDEISALSEIRSKRFREATDRIRDDTDDQRRKLPTAK
jgi:hypothetical protein